LNQRRASHFHYMARGRRQGRALRASTGDRARLRRGAFKNHAAQSGSPVVIPNHHPNVLNDAAAETDQIPAAVVAVPADG
jgi:hypothetical protein